MRPQIGFVERRVPAGAAEDDKPSRSEMIRRIVTDWLRQRGYLPIMAGLWVLCLAPSDALAGAVSVDIDDAGTDLGMVYVVVRVVNGTDTHAELIVLECAGLIVDRAVDVQTGILSNVAPGSTAFDKIYFSNGTQPTHATCRVSNVRP